MKQATPPVEVVELREWETRENLDVELSPTDREQATQLGSGGAGKLIIDELRHGLRVKASSWVGVVRFSNFEVQVRPKFAEENLDLVRLIAYAGGLDSFKRFRIPHNLPQKGHSLFDLVALLFAEACERLLKRGLLSDYKQLEEDLPVLRGRLLPLQQAVRRLGLLNRLECRYDEYLSDIPENQVLRGALEHCALRATYGMLMPRIRRLHGIFASVCHRAPCDPEEILENMTYNRLKEHYREPHELARLILATLGIKDLYSRGDARCFSFLVDMNHLFECFVSRWLCELLPRRGFQVQSQRRVSSIIWDVGTNCSYKRVVPDILVTQGGRRISGLPIDAKYIPYDERSLDEENIYQAFLYAYALGRRGQDTAPAALLLYPASAPGGKEHPSDGHRLEIRDTAGKRGAEISAIGIHIPSAVREAEEGEPDDVGRRVIEAVERSFAP